MKKWSHRIGPRVAFFYFIVVLVSITASTVIYSNQVNEDTKNRLQQASIQTLSAVRNNIRLTLSQMNDYSKLIFSNSKLQTLLRRDLVGIDLSLQSRVQVYLYSLIQAEPIIDSIFIFDFQGGEFSASLREPSKFLLNDVTQAPWFDYVIEQRGQYVLALNGGGAFQVKTADHYVSMIRLVRDVNYASNLGIMVINFSSDAFLKAFNEPLESHVPRIAILDSNRDFVVKLGEFDDNYQEILHLALQSDLDANGSQIKKTLDENYLITTTEDEYSTWTLISVTDIGTIKAGRSELKLVLLLLIVLNSLILLGSSIIISNIYSRPIKQLLGSMNQAKTGAYVLTDRHANSEEFEQLFEGYNEMISHLKILHQRSIVEQEVIRKAELRILQSQIKPHFLYNTLDSIVSLGLLGANEEAVQLTRALSDYYRLSVSKGQDIVTLAEEIDIVRKYMAIIRIRYPDMYEIHEQIDPDCLHIRLPKLILQPLVENAIYHGIRAKGASGTIRMKVAKSNNKIQIEISDDGIGMHQELINTVLLSEKTGSVKSFGLWGTMERLRIFCGRESLFISSTPGEGTSVRIELLEEENGSTL